MGPRTALALCVDAAVLADVADGVLDLPGGAQDVQMVAVGEDVTGPAHHAVELGGNTSAERAHPARERIVPIRLDNQMHVIRLDGELREPHPPYAAQPPEDGADGRHHARVAQIPYIRQHP